MRIFFTSPFPLPDWYQPFVDEVLTAIRKSKATIIQPGDKDYKDMVEPDSKTDSLDFKRAHYRFITQGIADADAVIIESSHEDFRVGHETTLALPYGKPTLVLSRHANYADYIPHELLHGTQYKTNRELKKAVRSFINHVSRQISSPDSNIQTIESAADSLHAAALASTRHEALHDTSEFGEWARLAESDQAQAYKIIQKSLGKLPVGKPWSVFASIYNEDTPDYVFSGAARFASSVFSRYQAKPNDYVVDAACGTGAISRNLVALGHRNVLAFDNSREMLGEAFRLCAHLPSVKPFEADIANVDMDNPVRGIVWFDFSSNFAPDKTTLKNWLENLLNNIEKGGCLIFDVRTTTGWQISFYRQKVTTYATANFQRIWINEPDYDRNAIRFDIFIRTRSARNIWGEWRREQMQERMWGFDEVKEIAGSLDNGQLESVYGDDFSLAKNGEKPGLAYFVIKRV